MTAGRYNDFAQFRVAVIVLTLVGGSFQMGEFWSLIIQVTPGNIRRQISTWLFLSLICLTLNILLIKKLLLISRERLSHIKMEMMNFSPDFVGSGEYVIPFSLFAFHND